MVFGPIFIIHLTSCILKIQENYMIHNIICFFTIFNTIDWVPVPTVHQSSYILLYLFCFFYQIDYYTLTAKNEFWIYLSILNENINLCVKSRSQTRICALVNKWSYYFYFLSFNFLLFFLFGWHFYDILSLGKCIIHCMICYLCAKNK